MVLDNTRGNKTTFITPRPKDSLPPPNAPNRFSSPDAEELEAYQDLFESQMAQDHPIPTPEDDLNAHYRNFIENDVDSPPPTPKCTQSASKSLKRAANIDSTETAAPPKPPACKVSKRKYSKKDTLTAEERVMDSSSGDENTPGNAAPMTTATQRRGSARPTLARRALDPLPSIDPSTVRGKDYKHPVATAMQVGNAAKIDMLRSANEWRQEFEAAKQLAEAEARQSDLSWAKEKFYLEREEERNRMALAREEERNRMAIITRNERKAFCEKLVLEGKTPQELEAYLRLVYPEVGPIFRNEMLSISF
ncbi:uncharacterized protein MELLADRAFT_101609 [Melampsora larici-populina 98AG31]|uniref:Uncharacterized protein n=1 Tax=Melampsora larici-populina (strain 98AG31 / pathotype 3-4-7) TaxID=747676 RepID=F4R6E3_MELLP|nr:uncharacterized protein MELLADRAFT_101609 [Melampsora larici-populina 98AG31]EGG11862.1 hypothetical protein MELLADRAFT_101609 [Melampsora larici-populina 98AG31]